LTSSILTRPVLQTAAACAIAAAAVAAGGGAPGAARTGAAGAEEGAAGRQRPSRFQLQEATVAGIHAAFRDRTLTCRSLVEQYFTRIEALDKAGPSLNAVVLVNTKALAAADDLDRRFSRSGPVGPMHCIPVTVKDNYETFDMPTTAGSLSLKGMMTGKDAFVVRRLRDAGAVMIAKSNMAEFAFSPVETVSSILPGYTRNPYDTRRATAGSSGGSAAATAANMTAIGLASDTGDSIRGPAAHQALVGLRSTMGLVSRAGVVPLNLAADIAGAVTRTVADTAAVLQTIAGEDPDDPVTSASGGHVDASYAAALRTDGLKGARLGVLHQAYDTPTLDGEVDAVFRRALADLRSLGATVVDPVAVEKLDEIRSAQGSCNQLRHDLNAYLAALGDKAPVHSLEEIITSRRFHPSIQARLESAQASNDVPGESPGCRSRAEFRAKLGAAVIALLDDLRLDALVYPTWSNPPRLIGDLNTPGGDNNQFFAPSTGFPAITVPMGYTRGNTLPAGLQFFGRAWSESTLIRLAYAYEQGTHHRRPPPPVESPVR
jgi:Asp-tRNA(Asn)/Glu-tRNA(Gln) amidotransferase A subunit family amidase